MTSSDIGDAEACARPRKVTPVGLERWLTNPDVLTSAALYVAKRRGAATPGIDGVVGSLLPPAACGNLATQLAAELRRGTYQPNDLRSFWQRKGGKARPLKIATIRDRVLQTTLLWGMEPYVAQLFAPGNYGVRGAGAVLAVSHVAAALEASLHCVQQDGQVHLVKTDVASFFDSIPHADLQRLIRRIFSGRRLTRVIAATLTQGQSHPGYGLAQGAPLSSLLANLYLNKIDWFFEQRRTVFYARYIDDVVIVVPGDLGRASANLHELERQVHALGLRLNRSKTFITPAAEGAEFLGFRLRLGAQAVEVTPSERSVARLKQRLDEVPENRSTPANLHAAKAAWAAYFGDLAPHASAIGDRLVSAELAARLLRRPVAETPVKRIGGTR